MSGILIAVGFFAFGFLASSVLILWIVVGEYDKIEAAVIRRARERENASSATPSEWVEGHALTAKAFTLPAIGVFCFAYLSVAWGDFRKGQIVIVKYMEDTDKQNVRVGTVKFVLSNVSSDGKMLMLARMEGGADGATIPQGSPLLAVKGEA
jgi:hypothetical protein